MNVNKCIQEKLFTNESCIDVINQYNKEFINESDKLVSVGIQNESEYKITLNEFGCSQPSSFFIDDLNNGREDNSKLVCNILENVKNMKLKIILETIDHLESKISNIIQKINLQIILAIDNDENKDIKLWNYLVDERNSNVLIHSKESTNLHVNPHEFIQKYRKNVNEPSILNCETNLSSLEKITILSTPIVHINCENEPLILSHKTIYEEEPSCENNLFCHFTKNRPLCFKVPHEECEPIEILN